VIGLEDQVQSAPERLLIAKSKSVAGTLGFASNTGRQSEQVTERKSLAGSHSNSSILSGSHSPSESADTERVGRSIADVGAPSARSNCQNPIYFDFRNVVI
jgi:hypothetical protein